MFIKNKYTKTYFSLMDKRKEQPSQDTYTEKHHIIPTCMGGINVASNLVILSGREHYIAHLLLTKMVQGNDRRKMAYALVCFNRTNPRNLGRNLPKSALYEYSKRLLSNTPVSAETAEKISQALKGRPRHPSVGKAISAKLKGRIFSVETRTKMSEAKKGKSLPENTRIKMSQSGLGKIFSLEHCANISAAYAKTQSRTLAIIESNKKKRKPCTVDGVNIFESKKLLELSLGRGRTGSRSPTFRFTGDNLSSI